MVSREDVVDLVVAAWLLAAALADHDADKRRNVARTAPVFLGLPYSELRGLLTELIKNVQQ
jgi:hypothetical protein